MKWFIFSILFLHVNFSYAQLNDKLIEKAVKAKNYCIKNKLNTSFCFLVDLSVNSGKSRFYIYDFKSNTIKSSGLVCHGVGKNSTAQQAVYSNEVGSNCTSLGKYKIGKRAYSNWGIHVHYKMHGLESGNSNAFQRKIVLHAYEYVPETDIFPLHLTMGWSQGCPVVANNLMTQIDTLLKKQKQPTLIWLFE
jgi:hypothetical protein